MKRAEESGRERKSENERESERAKEEKDCCPLSSKRALSSAPLLQGEEENSRSFFCSFSFFSSAIYASVALASTCPHTAQAATRALRSQCG
jgi:hypothetical protein